MLEEFIANVPEGFEETSRETYVENGEEHVEVNLINEELKEVIQKIESHKNYEHTSILTKCKYKRVGQK